MSTVQMVTASGLIAFLMSVAFAAYRIIQSRKPPSGPTGSPAVVPPFLPADAATLFKAAYEAASEAGVTKAVQDHVGEWVKAHADDFKAKIAATATGSTIPKDDPPK